MGSATFVAVLVGVLSAIALGCGRVESGVANAKLPDGARSQAIEHEACDESANRVEILDVDNDGRPDIRRVFDGTREICRISDLNRDGKPDMFEYFDTSGQLRRRESDFDDNGVVNAIETYRGGKLVGVELDIANQGRIDTWDTFDPNTGQRIKRERDTTGDGRVDQWWTYEGNRVTIAMDKNGDGQPDPSATITLGASGDALPEPLPAPPAIGADAGAPSSDEGSAGNAEPSDLSPTPDAGAPSGPKRGKAKR